MSISIDITKKLSSFTLEVAFDVSNETLGLLGASGCGKSMTMRCIAGVEKPDSGKIVVDGTTFFDSAAKIDLSPQKRKTALLFQNYQLFPNLTVQANIAAGIDRSVDAATRAQIIEAQLERFSLKGFEKRYPMLLSGGQQQRVALARMLAAQPSILMLDEPFSALDAHLKAQLEQDLLALFDTFEGSILYVSHDIDEAFRFCDRIAVIDQGSLCEIDSTEAIVNHPKTLATIKLSGCRNTSAATKVDSYTIDATDWGIRLTSSNIVPDDLRYIGIRGFYISRAAGQTRNVFPFRVERTSDSRFERTVTLVSAGAAVDEAGRTDDGTDIEHAATEHTTGRILWDVDKLSTPFEQLPRTGDVIDLFLDPRNIYMVTV